MPKQKLTCTCGHSWESDLSGPLPGDMREICPVCSGAGHTQEHPSATESRGMPDKPDKADKPAEPAESPLGLKPGQVLEGFEILGEINRGGMGVIYKARQQGLNRLVALKVIAPDRVGSSEAMRRFRREVQAAALLSHPNIVTVFHTDLDCPSPYLAMEYVAGVDLHKLVKEGGPLSMTDACYYIRQAAEGLQHAYEQGLVHRDIKPANLMVSPSPLDKSVPPGRKPRLKILDMGLARTLMPLETGEESGSLTQAGEFLGTPDYIAPEQAEDCRKADIRSDLYSLGGTMYFLLVGKVPFPSKSLVQKLRRQIMEPPPTVSDRRADVTGDVDGVVTRLMAREPEERFQTPQELIDALDEVVRNLPAKSGPPVLRRGPVAKSAVTPVPRAPKSAPTSERPSDHLAVREARAHDGGVRSLSVSTDGKLLLTGGQDETLRLWDATRLKEIRHMSGDVGPIEDVYLAPGAKWAASCALRLLLPDMAVQIWDLSTGREKRRLKGFSDNVTCVAVSPDARRVAAGSADHTIRIWFLDQQGFPSICLKGHTGRVSCLAFLPGEVLLSGSHDGSLRMWSAKDGATRGTLNVQVGRVAALAYGGPSKTMAIAGDGLRVRHASGSMIALTGHEGQVLGVAFSPDGNLVASAGADNAVRLWRAEDGEEVHQFTGHGAAVNDVAFSPDGQAVFSASADGMIRRLALPRV